MCKWAKQQQEEGRDERNRVVEEILQSMKSELKPPKVTVRWNELLKRYVKVQ